MTAALSISTRWRKASNLSNKSVAAVREIPVGGTAKIALNQVAAGAGLAQ